MQNPKDKSPKNFPLGPLKADAEAMLSVLTETMGEGFVIQNSKGEIIRCNQRACDLLGLTEDELLGRKSTDPRWKAIKRDGSPCPLEERPSMRALKTGNPVHGTVMGIILPSKEERWVLTNATPFDNSNERQVLVTFSDVTEALTNESQINDIFSASLDLICIANTNGYFKRINPSFTRILGYKEQEVLSEKFINFIHPDDIAPTMKVVETLAQGQLLLNFENRYRTKNGEYRIISWHCQPNTRTGDLFAIGRDITESKKRETGFRQFMLGLNTTAIVAFTDEKGVITEVNEKFCEISGYSRDELIGKTHRIVNSNTHPKEFFTQMWQTISSGKTWTGDIQNRKKGGELYWVRTVITPMVNEDKKIINYVAVRFDVTAQKKTEQQLAQKTAQLKEAQSIAKIGSWSHDLKTQELTWSLEQYRIFEFEESENRKTLYSQFRSRIHPEDITKLDLTVDGAIKKGTGFVIEHRLLFENGRVKNVQSIGKVVKDENQNVIGLRGTCQDITERVQKEEENRFILDALGIGVWKFNPVTQALHWDQSMYKIYDMNEKDFSSHYMAWESSLTPEAKIRAVDELGKALRGEKEFNTTFEIQTRSRGVRIIAGRGKVIRNQKGEPIMMYGVNYDVTEQKHTESEKEKLASFLNIVLNNVPSMIFVKDYQNNLSFSLLNKEGEALLGLKQSQILGKTDYDFFPKEQADFFVQKDKSVFESRKPLKIEVEEIDTATGKRYLSTSKVPTFDDRGNPQLLIGISNDITEEIKAKEAFELERSKALRNAKLASLGEMSAGVAHEINNPVTIILGTLRFIVKDAHDPEKLNERVQTIEKASNRIAKIVSGLRKFSRSSEKSDHKPHPLKDIIEEALVLTGSKSRRDSTPVDFTFSTDGNIICDEIETEQVFVNLINNGIDAVKNLSEKWVRISLFEDKRSVIVQIRDSGKGISPEIQKKLFQPFFTTKKVGEGTGLGLSIVKGILDEHKASIDVVASDPNTCFEIRFTKAEAQKNAA